MSKQWRLTSWLKTREGEPPAKHGRQDTENSAKGATLDPASLSSSSDAHSCFDPGRLSTSNVELQSYSKPYDIGNIAPFARIGNIAPFARDLNKEDMFSVLNNIYQPPSNYVFPQHTEGPGSHKRSFQLKWLNEHTWLAYSREKDGGYCVPCLFFCKDPEGLGKLVNSPLIKFKDAVNTLCQHCKKSYHINAVSDMLMFMQVMNNERQPIDHQLVSALAQQVQTNRELLKSIIKTVIFCGKQSIALRGHRDDLQHLQQPGNHGNFHALLSFRTEAGDKTLQTHLDKAPHNARYT